MFLSGDGLLPPLMDPLEYDGLLDGLALGWPGLVLGLPDGRVLGLAAGLALLDGILWFILWASDVIGRLSNANRNTRMYNFIKWTILFMITFFGI